MSEQKVAVIINPHFKGLVNYPSAVGLTLVGGQIEGDQGHRPATDEEYLSAVRRCAVECPELAQTLARTVAAAILAYEFQRAHVDVRLVSVEGCMHRIGPFKARGYEIVGTIWEKVVFPRYHEVEQALIGSSCCTVEESRAIMDEALKGTANTQIQCVTHGYHQDRVDKTLRDALKRANAYGRVTLWPTLTPEGVLYQCVLSEKRYWFLREIILAAEPTKAHMEAEHNAEFPIRALHAVSSFVERLTFGKVNIETWLAGKRRNKLMM